MSPTSEFSLQIEWEWETRLAFIGFGYLTCVSSVELAARAIDPLIVSPLNGNEKRSIRRGVRHMRQLWKVSRAVLTGLAIGLVAKSGSVAFAQCANGSCGGTMAGSYVPGGMGSGGTDSFANLLGKGTQPLFDNYFTRGYANNAEAALYMSPIGVPGWVGHTYNTYQPLYPHQFLYQHHDRYHSYYDQGMGLNRTSAKYYAPPVRTAGKKVYKMLEIPR
jgi:hypothetical protein